MLINTLVNENNKNNLYYRYESFIGYIKDIFNIPYSERLEDHILAIEFATSYDNIHSKFVNKDNKDIEILERISENVNVRFISMYQLGSKPNIDIGEEVMTILDSNMINTRLVIKIWYLDLMFYASYHNEVLIPILPNIFKSKYCDINDESGHDKMIKRFNYNILRHGSNATLIKYDTETLKEEGLDD